VGESRSQKLERGSTVATIKLWMLQRAALRVGDAVPTKQAEKASGTTTLWTKTPECKSAQSQATARTHKKRGRGFSKNGAKKG